jgi:integrase
LLFTGCRLGEILGLRWLDVDMRRNVVSIVQQKTGKQKTLPIEGEFREVLLALPRSVGAAPVFTRPDGRPFAAIDVQRAFGVARKLSGIRAELTPHSLRHTFASWLAISGQPLRTIQELLGHADIRMTIRYSHLSPAHLSDAMRTVGLVAESGKTGDGQRAGNVAATE